MQKNEKRKHKMEQVIMSMRILGFDAHFCRAGHNFYISIAHSHSPVLSLDLQKVQDALKEHAIAVRDPPQVQAVSVTSHRTSLDTKNVWKQIYASPDLYSR